MKNFTDDKYIDLFRTNSNAIVRFKVWEWEVECPEDTYYYDTFSEMMGDIKYTVNCWIDEGAELVGLEA